MAMQRESIHSHSLEDLVKNTRAPGALGAFISALDLCVSAFESAMTAGRRSGGQERFDEARDHFEQAARVVVEMPRVLEPVLSQVDQPLRAKLEGYLKVWAEMATDALPGGRDYESRGVLLIPKGAKVAADNDMRSIVRYLQAQLSPPRES